ncbi:hypothetical protein PUNSTDRAFT_109938 [Punctularia strigosozonata HHB-11173 SS5]|uniref:uncharacterized protein n=1 Tax=Punctularia strigosozonata (strain HHB-11173) TaxID=741275 RepID=UPI0004416F2A|nr:uncharacterized protein PUNSTDRAFT_109938 [Punctularia strigosozonata HHB-11173 SS5]EIN13754.1 hypothetical protein PUNSTDRAFT_109938 [Punctularia strigosozonata HHB-11173 SS5]
MLSANIGDGAQISVAAGITIGLIASFVQSLGLTIQRKSHVVNQSLPEDQQRVEHRRPLWLLGFAIFISSNILGSIFQIAALPVVILGPLGAVSLLWNAFFARVLLGDVFSPYMVLGTLFIAGGAVLIALFGIVPEPNHTLDDLLALLRRPPFVAYFSILLAVVVVSLIVTHIVEYSLARQPIGLPPSPPLSPTAPTQRNSLMTHSDLTTERTPLLMRKHSSPESVTSDLALATKPSGRALFVAVSYASFSGILSGMCLIFAKSGVELLMLTIGGKNQFWRWEAWVLLLGLVVFALLQLWYLHKSLVLADPTLVCPLAFCFYNLSSIFNGLVYFDQFSLLSTRNLLLVILGIAVLLGGVWVVSIPTDADSAGGFDIGTWQEAMGPEPEEDEVEAGGMERDRVRQRQQSIGMEPVSTPVDTVSPSSPPLVDVDDPFGHPPAPASTGEAHSRHPSGHESPGSDATMSPGTARSRGLYHYQRRRPTVIGTGESQPSRMISPPLSTHGLPLPGGGFSIGLSPVSPGFALVPRGRDGRRVSGHGQRGFADVVQAGLQLRRTASEGDVGPEVGAGDAEGADLLSHVEAGYPSPQADGGRRDEAASPAQRRWKWLGKVLSRARR